MDSATAGYLINTKPDATDLLSLLPKWGHEGLIKILAIPKKGWVGKFEALNITPPKWYTSSNTVNTMGMAGFADSFSSQMTAMRSTMVSTPKSNSSSGGGFAGSGAGRW